MKGNFRDRKLVGITLISAILTVNLAGYLAAYSSTNYRDRDRFSLAYPRPENQKTPRDFDLNYSRQRLPINQQEWLETWMIKSNTSETKGTVILFHGKDSTKSSLLAPAQVFHQLGYTSVLVDFRGVGGSSGHITTIGVQESQDVAVVVNWAKKLNPEQPIILYGISMGSAAILRAIAVEKIQPNRIILELPFSSLLSAVENRLSQAKIPPFPLAESMVFWGGIQHGFNGFKHNPVDYALKVNCPTLVLQGEQDTTVDLAAINNLYQNLNAPKKLVSFPDGGHQLLVKVDEKLWRNNVQKFLAVSSEQ